MDFLRYIKVDNRKFATSSTIRNSSQSVDSIQRYQFMRSATATNMVAIVRTFILPLYYVTSSWTQPVTSY